MLILRVVFNMNDVILEQSEKNLKPAVSFTSTSLLEPIRLRINANDTISRQTLPDFVHECFEKYSNLPALVWETPGTGKDGWTILTYADFEQRVNKVAMMLMYAGLEKRSSVGILAFNCPEWFIAELGALRAAGIVAGIYPSNSAEAVYHALKTSDATVCIVDDDKQMAKLRAIKDTLPRLKSVIQIHGPFEHFVNHEVGYYSWESLLEHLTIEDKELQEDLLKRESCICVNECAMLIFTSGTVGMPKAVMLSHDNVVFGTRIVESNMENVVIGQERLVSYLPLSHIAAQIFDIFLSLAHGGCVYFADKDALKGTLVQTFLKAKPTRVFGVPRVFEKFQERLVAAEVKASPFSRKLLAIARKTVAQHNLTFIARDQSFYSNVKYWMATRFVKPIRQMLGLDHCKIFLTGGAPVSAELKDFFLGLDMAIADVYGLSETSGAVTLHTKMSNIYSSGTPLAGVSVKIHEPDTNGHGEIIICGRNIFMGYLNDREKTDDTLDEDGWYHTGDLGCFDAFGNIVISGRIKELIITTGGENIPPAHIEELIKRELPCVGNAFLVGDQRKYLTVLLTLKTNSDSQTGIPLDSLREETQKWLQCHGLNQTCLSKLLNIPSDLQLPNESNALSAALEINAEPKLLESLEAGINRANKHSISNAQRVQKFAILPHEFSLATGELGPTLKIRRNIVVEKYAKVIERLYK